MKPQQTRKRFSKFITYVLGYRPDEFGLVPDENGYVKIKELLKAISEEEGWKHVRRANIDELLITGPDTPIEISDNRIRATDRDRLAKSEVTQQLPKLLYTCVRRKAYPHVCRKGIFPTYHSQIVLASDQNMAHRIGSRSDADPILLTVQVQQSLDLGVVYYLAGEGLFLADFVPTNGFSGPPLPKESPDDKKQPPADMLHGQKQPGTFKLDPESFAKKYGGKPNGKRRKSTDWKKDRKQARKFKNKFLNKA